MVERKEGSEKAVRKRERDVPNMSEEHRQSEGTEKKIRNEG